MDQFYYESGYIDESYFVYVADAESIQSSQFTQTCDASVLAGGAVVEGSGSWLGNATVNTAGQLIAGGASTMTAQFVQSAMISHIEGADLFAMNSAALTAQVSRIRNNNIQVSGAYTLAASVARTRWFSGSMDAAVDAAIVNSRVRYDQADMSSAFSITAIGNIIKNSSIALNSYTALSTTVSRTRNVSSVLSSIVTISVQIKKFVNVQSSFNSYFTETAKLVKRTEYWISNATTDFVKSKYDSIGNLFGITSTNTIQKIDKYGVLVSEYSFSSLVTKLADLDIDPSNNIYIIGETSAFDIFGAKLDNTLQIVWKKSYAATSKNLTAQNCYFNGTYLYATGTITTTSPSYVATFLKINASSGTLSISYDSNISNSTFKDILPAVSIYASDVYVVGYEPGGSTYRCGLLNKFNSANNWTGYFSTDLSKSGNILSADIDSNKNIICVIYEFTTSGISKYHVAKVDTNGNLIWAKTINSSNIIGISSQSIKVDHDNKIYITGKDGSSNFIICFSENGDNEYINVIDRNNLIENYQPISLFDNHISLGTMTVPLNGSGTGIYDTFTYSNITNITVSNSSLILGSFSNPIYPDYAIVSTNNSATISSNAVSISNIEYIEFYGLREYGIATLNSVSSLITSIGKSVSIEARLASNVLLTTTSTIIKKTSATLQSTGFVVAVGGRIRPFVDIEVSTFTLASSPNVIRNNSAQLNSNVNLTANNNRLRNNNAGLSTNAELSVSVGNVVQGISTQTIATILTATSSIIRNAVATLACEGFETVVNGRIRSEIAQLSSAFTFNINVNKIAGVSSTQSANVALTSTATRIKQFNSQMQVNAFDLSVINKIGNTLIHLDSTSNLNITINVLSGQASIMTSFATLVANIKRTRYGIVNAQSTATLTARPEGGKIAEAHLTSIASVTIAADKRIIAQADLQSTATLTASIGKIKQGAEIVWATSTMVAQGNVIRSANSHQSSNLSVNVLAGKQVVAHADLYCEGFELVFARILRLDETITYRIPAEDRYYKISGEVRTAKIQTESRSWIVDPETYVWTIPFEDRSYKIKE